MRRIHTTAIPAVLTFAAALCLAAPSTAFAQDTDRNASQTPATQPAQAAAEERPQYDPRMLNSDEVKQVARRYDSDVMACYRKHALKQKRATGQVRFHAIIHPLGHVWKIVAINAPGVRGKKFDRCVRTTLRTWNFPAKTRFSEVVVPYFFLKTNAPNTGPLKSCWSPKGCKTLADPTQPEPTKKSRKAVKPKK